MNSSRLRDIIETLEHYTEVLENLLRKQHPERFNARDHLEWRFYQVEFVKEIRQLLAEATKELDSGRHDTRRRDQGVAGPD